MSQIVGHQRRIDYQGVASNHRIGESYISQSNSGQSRRPGLAKSEDVPGLPLPFTALRQVGGRWRRAWPNREELPAAIQYRTRIDRTAQTARRAPTTPILL